MKPRLWQTSLRWSRQYLLQGFKKCPQYLCDLGRCLHLKQSQFFTWTNQFMNYKYFCRRVHAHWMASLVAARGPKMHPWRKQSVWKWKYFKVNTWHIATVSKQIFAVKTNKKHNARCRCSVVVKSAHLSFFYEFCLVASRVTILGDKRGYRKVLCILLRRLYGKLWACWGSRLPASCEQMMFLKCVPFNFLRKAPPKWKPERSVFESTWVARYDWTLHERILDSTATFRDICMLKSWPRFCDRMPM